MYKAKFVALLWILFIEKKIDIIEQNDPKILCIVQGVSP